MSTMREVAALARVSGKTVSRVINGDRYVSDQVRARVEQAIAQLEYVPNMLSQTFRSGRDSAIGVAVPDIADGFFGAVIQSVEQCARTRGTAVIVTSLGDDPDGERPAVQALLSRQVAGLIIAPISTDQSYLTGWQARTELVFIDRPAHRITADTVIEDDFGGAATAVEHLIDRGHRRIAFIGNAAAVVTTGRRLDGYRSALSAAGLPHDPELELQYQGGAAAAVELVRSLLQHHDPATAIFSSNSQSSVAIVPELHASGHSDLAFISFGDFPMAAALRPSVTVLDQNPAKVGTAAARRLFERIDGPPDGARSQVAPDLILPVPLVIRESSGGPTHPHHPSDHHAPDQHPPDQHPPKEKT
ncbi:LacI family transcriptional regulator [Nakamurella sp. UYEF19]|uniref:LacI family DNA-binding transcriptional regulator n=1 Tax=Nakamurella sp. UYEF19 TaxID=1756392 RepID=UPI00339671AD